MPNSQLTLDGTVFDRGGTAVTGGRVTVFNFTKSNESTSVPIGSNGEYTINLANLATQWEAADVIYVVAKNNSANPDYGVVRWVIGGADQAESRDIYLRSGDVFNAAGGLQHISHASASVGGTAHDFYLIDRKTDKVLCLLKCAASGKDDRGFGFAGGVKCYDGFYMLRTATDAAVTASPHAQTPGSASMIGDTTTNGLIVTTVSVG